MALVFDGPNRIIYMDNVVRNLTVEYLEARWNDWVHSDDGSLYPPAFGFEGGTPLGGGADTPYFLILRNDLGWRIEKPNTNDEYTIFGNLIGGDPNANIFSIPIGFNPVVTVEKSNIAVISGEIDISDEDKQDIADTIVAQLTVNGVSDADQADIANRIIPHIWAANK